MADLQTQLAASEAQGASLQLEKDQLTVQTATRTDSLPYGGLSKRPDDPMAPVRSTKQESESRYNRSKFRPVMSYKRGTDYKAVLKAHKVQ